MQVRTVQMEVKSCTDASKSGADVSKNCNGASKNSKYARSIARYIVHHDVWKYCMSGAHRLFLGPSKGHIGPSYKHESCEQ